MGNFLNILENLQETESEISRLKNEIGTNPSEFNLGLMLESLYMRQKNLQDDFSSTAHEEFLDVCTYRLIPKENDRPSLSTIGRALCDFQALFTLVYDSVKNGPKDRSSFSAEIAKESAFDFGYSFSGSIGFALTMPNQRLLLGETELDRAMGIIFELAKANDSENVRSFARMLGRAAIRKIYEWANNHVDASLDADIQWKRNDQIRSKLFIQSPELSRLKNIIDETTEEEPMPIEVSGKLIGGDIKTGLFHMAFEGGAEDIKGRLGEGVSISNKELDRVYTASLLKVTKIFYSLEREDVSYVLLSLNPSNS